MAIGINGGSCRSLWASRRLSDTSESGIRATCSCVNVASSGCIAMFSSSASVLRPCGLALERTA